MKTEAYITIYGNFILGADDAHAVAKILARATKVDKDYSSVSNTPIYKLDKQRSTEVTYFSVVEQADILMQLETST
jgi:hypothetical protein